MKNRMELAELFKTKEYTKGAEIGVWDGFYSGVLLRKIPNLTLYCVDPWTPYKGYRDHELNNSFQKAYDDAVKLLKPLGAHLMKMTSEEAVKQFTPESLDFVFIDGNHAYPFVKQDIELWSPIVRKGGIVSGHDYYVTKTGNVGVIRAVNDYVASNNYTLETTDWDQTQPREDDRQPCWYFMK